MIVAGPVLVTGASGFVGQALTAALLARGVAVRGASRRRPAVRHALLEWVPCDLTDARADFDALVRGTSCIYHLAWSSVPASADDSPADDLQANLVPTVRLATAAAASGVRLLFTSSGGTVYGRMRGERADEGDPCDPLSFYGLSKLTSERYLGAFAAQGRLDHACIRIGNVYGPGQTPGEGFGVVATFAGRALRGEPVTIFGDGRSVRDYVYIDDVVEALLAARSARDLPPALNVGAGRGASVGEIVALLADLLGREVAVSFQPARGYDVPANVLEVSLAAARLGWRPRTPLREGLVRTLQSLRGHPREHRAVEAIPG